MMTVSAPTIKPASCGLFRVRRSVGHSVGHAGRQAGKHAGKRARCSIRSRVCGGITLHYGGLHGVDQCENRLLTVSARWSFGHIDLTYVCFCDTLYVQSQYTTEGVGNMDYIKLERKYVQDRIKTLRKCLDADNDSTHRTVLYAQLKHYAAMARELRLIEYRMREELAA